jgi:hypothetical protein
MKPPRIPSVFKLGKYSEPRRFNYEPRTFDEKKQKLEKRRREIEQELAKEQRLGEKHEAHLRENIHDSWARRETRRQNRNAGRRLLLILASLIVILYLLYTKFEFLL